MNDHKLDLEQIRAVVKIASEADIAELEVESPTIKISVKKGPTGTRAVTAHVSPPAAGHPVATAPVQTPLPAVATDHLVSITAPMVGTFYRAPNPDAPPLIIEGDFVEPGQTVCIIEAMKLFNEIQSELRGRIARVLVENASPVEYGQPLMLIDPTISQ